MHNLHLLKIALEEHLMLCKNFKFILLCLFLILRTENLSCLTLLTGNNTQDSSFDFQVGPYAINRNNNFYIGTGASVTNNYSIAMCGQNSLIFKPICPETVTFNWQASQPNPLYNQRINTLSAFAGNVVATTIGNPDTDKKVFIVSPTNDANNNVLMFGTEQNLKDGYELEISKILATEAASFINGYEVEDANAIIVSVKNNFANDGLSLAFIKFAKNGDEQQESLHIINPVSGQPGNASSKIDPASNIIAVGNPTTLPTFDTNFTSLHRDADLKVTFAGLKIVNTGSAGAKAVFLTAEAKNGTLMTFPIAPNNAFSTQDNIIATANSSSSIYIYNLKTILTSTYLKYLIVARGDDNTGARNVYALPLINSGSFKLPGSEETTTFDGWLANVNQLPTTFFSPIAPYRFSGNQNLSRTRAFTQPAIAPGQLYTTSSIQARVGGQVDLPGVINNLQAFKDAVFVSVTPDAGKAGGIFHSQALFDSNGMIKGWTNWKHCVNTGAIDFNPHGFAYDNEIASHYVISSDKKSVYKTAWSNGESDLEKLVTAELPQEKYGVQAIKNFSAGYNCNTGSFVCLSGLNKILLIQTGYLNNTDDFISELGNYSENIFKSTDGTLSGFDNTKNYLALSISGGDLDKIKAITTTECIDGKYLCCGGSKGLAVLANDDGSGYLDGINSNFSNLTPDMKFRLIENFKNIIKISSQNEYLFVLTNKNLYRIRLTPDNIINNNLETIVLAKASDLAESASFADMLLSNNLIVIGHSKGLMQNNLNNIKTASSIGDMGWENIALPEAAGSLNNGGPITRLFAISPTENEKDILGQAATGNVIALNGYVSYNTAQVYRFNINDFGKLELFPDYFAKDIKTFFTNLGEYKNYFTADGAAYWSSRSANKNLPPFLVTLDKSLRSGQSGTGKADLSKIDNPGKLFVAPISSKSIRQLTFTSSGEKMIAGDFGIRSR